MYTALSSFEEKILNILGRDTDFREFPTREKVNIVTHKMKP